MSTVLLILEKQSEKDFANTILMKLGFDVLQIYKGAGVREKLQNQVPDLVVTSFFSSDAKSLDEFTEMRKIRGYPKFIWVGARSKTEKLNEQQKSLIDEFIPSPIMPENLISAISTLLEIQKEELIAKYKGLFSNEDSYLKEEESLVKKRKMTYEKLMSEMDAIDKVFSAKDLKSHDQMTADDEAEEFLDQKKDFLKKLFKKS